MYDPKPSAPTTEIPKPLSTVFSTFLRKKDFFTPADAAAVAAAVDAEDDEDEADVRKVRVLRTRLLKPCPVVCEVLTMAVLKIPVFALLARITPHFELETRLRVIENIINVLHVRLAIDSML